MTHADRVYLDAPEQGVEYTFSETDERARRIASALTRFGGTRGDRVLIFASNSAEFLLSWFGAATAGMIEVPVNTAYEGSFLSHQVAISRPQFVIIDADLVDKFIGIANECPPISRFFVIGKGEDSDRALAKLGDAGWNAAPFRILLDSGFLERPFPRISDAASILFTSGTTGPSKGVTMPHGQMHFFAEECVSLTRLTDNDVYLSVGPLFHGNAQFLAAYPALIAGARFVLRGKFSASQWLSWIRSSGATVTNFVGVMMDFVWRQPANSADSDNALRCVFAAPTADYVDQFRERFAIDTFVEVFGLTETSMPIMSPYGRPRPLGAVGQVVDDWFDVKLVDSETDEEVPLGEVGELVVRPKVPWTVSLGYFGMPEKTVECWRNLWFHTGDALRRDEGGWYYFVDRLKDTIRRRGENISSYEVEQAMVSHPDILECAAVAVKADVEAGEDEILLVVTPGRPGALTPDDVWNWAERQLPYFAIPRYVRFVAALPVTPSGKIRKADLRAMPLDADVIDREESTSGSVS